METEAPDDHHEAASLESILEALLVDDADFAWDPVTGRPTVTARPKSELDRLAESE